MNSVHETGYPRLKADVSEQELAEIFTTSAMERSFARKHDDTQAHSAPVFGLAYLQGINLMPRIRNLKLLVIRGKIPEVSATLDGQGFSSKGRCDTGLCASTNFTPRP